METNDFHTIILPLLAMKKNGIFIIVWKR